jgi:penicillin amidase
LREIGPLSMGGSDTVTMNATYRPNDFRVTLGASARLVFDVGAWDNSVCINAPGQSGVPQSRHYDDLAPLWAKGDYVPLLYSSDAVDRATQRRIVLTPARRSHR